MTQGWGNRRNQLIAVGILVVLEAIALPRFAGAQLIPDDTLGTEASVIRSNVPVAGSRGDRIEGGVQRGSALFHSFSQFSVGEQQRIYFANPSSVETILTRVTGGNPSNILGTLGVDGSASLFLINPAGILFGTNAHLDIAGSFVASTADRLVWEEGTQFSASQPTAPPLLNIRVTPGLQYGDRPGPIVSSGNLAVGQDLSLAGGNVTLQGQLTAGQNLTLRAIDVLTARDSAAQPFIASAGGMLLVQGDRTVDIFALNHSASGFFAGSNIVLRSAEPIGGDVHYFADGNFRVEQLDGSAGSWFSPSDPVIRANGDVSFTNYTGASLHILQAARSQQVTSRSMRRI
jgi:filamentous hemagglutinin family protein